MRLRSGEFKALKVYQRCQSGRGYQPHKAPLKQVQPSRLYSQSFSILSISFKYLFAKNRLVNKPIKDNTTPKPKTISKKLFKFLVLSINKLLPNPALNKSSLSFTIWYLAFKTSNLKSLLIIRAFIIADHIFYAIKRFSFDVVVNKRFNPRWNIIPISNSVIANISNFSKLFFIQTSLFKKRFKIFISHYNPLKSVFSANYIIFVTNPYLFILTICTDLVTIFSNYVSNPYIIQSKNYSKGEIR